MRDFMGIVLLIKYPGDYAKYNTLAFYLSALLSDRKSRKFSGTIAHCPTLCAAAPRVAEHASECDAQHGHLFEYYCSGTFSNAYEAAAENAK